MDGVAYKCGITRRTIKGFLLFVCLPIVRFNSRYNTFCTSQYSLIQFWIFTLSRELKFLKTPSQSLNHIHISSATDKAAFDDLFISGTVCPLWYDGRSSDNAPSLHHSNSISGTPHPHQTPPLLQINPFTRCCTLHPVGSSVTTDHPTHDRQQ